MATDINELCKRRQNFTLRVLKKKQEVQRVQTHSYRRFLRHLRGINWENPHCRVYLRVSDGKYPEAHGRVVTFYNDGYFNNKKELWETFNAFMGKETHVIKSETITDSTEENRE